MPTGGDAPAIDFPDDHRDSRTQLLVEAERAGAAVVSLPIDATGPDGETLSIDGVVLGSPRPKRAVVVSSGVHGVETPLGSAVQTAWLRRAVLGGATLPGECAFIAVHAINPYGFAWSRRFNEHNVDLNRNFLLDGDAYSGAAPMAAAFRSAFVDRKPRLSASARMALLAARLGPRAFWETLPPGQYEHADWLFYGGKALSASGERLREWLPTVLGRAEEVVWLDYHTGLGRYARGELLLSEGEPNEEIDWWRRAYPEAPVVASAAPQRYAVRGGFGPWLQAILPQARLHYATAEFGTYPGFRVLRAMIKESLATLRNPAIGPDHPARRRLREVFAPRSSRWRLKTRTDGLAWVSRATELIATRAR